MQIMPPTAQMLGFQGTLFQLEDMYTNIRLGTRYLAEAYRQASGDLCTTVMKYRAGHGETRFSYRSVEYCRRARAILRREDIEVTGELPTPTFGLPAMAGAGRSGNSGGGSGSGACIARQLRPGPGYMRCLRHAKGKTARSIASARRSLFQ